MSLLILAFLAAFIAGFSRGFAAFGTAMIYVPLVTLAYDAETAVVTLFLIDLLPSIPLVWKAVPHCDRRTIFWMTVGAIALSPIGVMMLLIVNQTVAQFGIGLFILLATSYMLTGRAASFGATPARSIGAGAISGFIGGISGIFGPPAMIYLLGRKVDARTTRADAIVFLTGESLILGATYLLYGMITLPRLHIALMLVAVYAASIWIGAKGFSRLDEAIYRRFLLWMLLAISAAIIAKSLFAFWGS